MKFSELLDEYIGLQIRGCPATGFEDEMGYERNRMFQQKWLRRTEELRNQIDAMVVCREDRSNDL